MGSDNLRTETIQVAAVAVALVEDLDTGIADVTTNYTSKVLREVDTERLHQEVQHGTQHHDPFTWLMILMEEVGELADEIPYLVGHPGSGLHYEISRIGRGAKNFLETMALAEPTDAPEEAVSS